MATSARLDSGAEAIILRQSTVENHSLPLSTGADTTVMFGNGQTTTTNRQTNLGGLPAIVCEDRNLQEDLISVNPLLDAGYRLTMEGNHGTLTKDEAGSSISVVREGARWSVDLRNTEPSSNDYSNIRDTVEAYAVINADSKSLRLRVISLHERLGHATPKLCATPSVGRIRLGLIVTLHLLKSGG